MHRLSSAFLLVVTLVALPWVAGANCEQAGRCTADAQCQIANDNEYQFCDLATGTCGCTEIRGCGAGDFCNVLGRCQPISGCLSNADCGGVEGEGCGREICDTKSGQCVGVCECDPEAGESCCTLDSHCGFGNVCDTFDGRCVPGCRSDGDCLLGEGCIQTGLGSGLGECAAGVCTANNLCAFGETCNLEEGECVFDTRGPYCLGCTGGVASDDCGEPANYCLTDSSDAGGSEFCGVDCSLGQPCPFGYSCNDVIIIPPAAPFCSAEGCIKAPGAESGTCSNAGTSCQEDEDCPIGLPFGDCPRGRVGNCQQNQLESCESDGDCCEDPAECPEGSCVFQFCVGGEGDAFGYCTCTRDTDCPRDECVGADESDPQNPIPGNCRLSGHTCYDDIDCDVIACIDGGCRIGANCAPANDRNCRELVITPE